jgi:hypothetical protein
MPKKRRTREKKKETLSCKAVENSLWLDRSREREVGIF